MKVLTFVIPAYNSEKFLDKCIPSMLAPEVLDKLEIIVVNDGSTDATAALAEKYCAQYPQVVRLISQENKGHGGALNTGCAAAQGKYLKVIDADDWVETQNLPKFVQRLEACESDVVLTHYHTINITTGEVKNWKTYPMEFDRSYRVDEVVADWESFDRNLTFHGISYKTEFYRKRGIRLSEHVFYEDHEYATFPCCHAESITPVDLFVYDYRIGDVQQSVSDANQLKRLSHSETVLERMMAEHKKMVSEDQASGREFVCRKMKVLLLSYITTLMLVEGNKKAGRTRGDQMMKRVQTEMSGAYALANKQYQVFRMMNLLHISKNAWDRFLGSDLYRRLRRKHDFN